ncbi:hypothetical protein MYCTH_96070 [Thermothelomyces thermophilus ATCC 42464]|uniref:Uncharacterized protein n=1 Tax=Thermothelomyces thermophilus (strain ATCC 42464 / BCRC 31852 / DSM 1799) TaxID=573729 RepID=G2QJM7_THET4|nr:uncharacterized protein MYCTH_96070 [Thermothelomyces thermophilus ATCC 42464]AEO59784.1 hypothetical protein MYCTH_96070 [Thermothelomyces thermophilus ATCC 42464]
MLTSPLYYLPVKGAYYTVLIPKFSILATFAPALAYTNENISTLVNTNATLIAHVLGTLLPASYTRLSASIYPVPMPINFGRSYARRSSLPAECIIYLVRDRDDPTLTTITIVLEGEDKEEKVVKYVYNAVVTCP